MPSGKRVLVLYYSLTGQTKRVVDILEEEFRAQGHEVDIVRLSPVREFPFPWGPFRLLGFCLKTYLGFDLTVKLKEYPGADRIGPSDVVVFGYQPWFLTPSAAVNSYLDSDASRALAGKKVVSLITARQLWKRSFRILERKVRERGAEVVESLVYVDAGEPPNNMVSTVTYLLTGKDISRGRMRKWFAPFGLVDSTMRQAREDLRRVASRLAQGEL